MLELRYNGCPDCLKSMKTVLRAVGFFSPQHFRVEFHRDHKDDKIYQLRPDYLKYFTGGILYNPDTQHWIDFYDQEHESMVLTAENDSKRKKLHSLVDALSKGA